MKEKLMKFVSKLPTILMSLFLFAQLSIAGPNEIQDGLDQIQLRGRLELIANSAQTPIDLVTQARFLLQHLGRQGDDNQVVLSKTRDLEDRLEFYTSTRDWIVNQEEEENLPEVIKSRAKKALETPNMTYIAMSQFGTALQKDIVRYGDIERLIKFHTNLIAQLREENQGMFARFGTAKRERKMQSALNDLSRCNDNLASFLRSMERRLQEDFSALAVVQSPIVDDGNARPEGLLEVEGGEVPPPAYQVPKLEQPE